MEKTALCTHCKKKQPVFNCVVQTLKNGRTCVKGICSVCGTKVFRLIKKTEADQWED